MNREGRILYGALMLAGSAMTFLKLLLAGRFLSRADFGQYSYVSVVVPYLVPLATLGILDGLSRRYPLLLGMGRIVEATRLRNGSLTGMLLIAPLALLSTYAALRTWGGTGRSGRWVVGLATVQVLSLTLFWFGLREIRARLRLGEYAGLSFARPALEIVGLVLMAPRFGVAGVLGAEIAVLTLLGGLMLAVMVPDVRLSLAAVGEAIRVVPEGAWIVGGGILANTALMGDRLILGAVLPRSDYASYAFHLLLLSGALVASNVCNQYVIPHLLQLYGTSGDPRAVLSYVSRVARRLALGSIVAAPVAAVGIASIRGLFFPGYALDRTLLAIVCVAAIVEVANVFPLALLALGRLGVYAGIQLFTALFVIGTVGLLLTRTRDLTAFALVLLGGRVLAGTLSLLAARRGQGGLPA